MSILSVGIERGRKQGMEQGRARGRIEGRAAGNLEGKRESILALLGQLGPVPEELKAEIETQKAMFYLQQQDNEEKKTE